jgi:cell division protein FtsL
MVNDQLQTEVKNLKKFNKLQKHNDPKGISTDRINEIERNIAHIQSSISQEKQKNKRLQAERR